jgi:DNA-directed RNA polymerase subunit L
MFSNYQESGAPLMTDPARKEKGTFTLAPTHLTIANSIVRIIQSKVATVGFRTEPPEESEVQILENTTPLPNEMLSHRIGMIPIAISNIEDFDPKRYKVELTVSNPTQEPRPVTTKDMKVYYQDSDGWQEIDNSKWFPADSITNDHILITTLRPKWSSDNEERITITAVPSVSTGEENIRYSPVCVTSYGYTIDPNPQKQEQFFQNWLLESKKIKDVGQVNPTQMNALQREWRTLEIQRCFLVDEKDEPYSFDFEVETNGIISVPVVVHRSIRELKKILQRYEILDTTVPANITIQPTQGSRKGIEILFSNSEDHTLGNLLQTFLVERHIQGNVAPRLVYASYKMGHPLKKELVLEIGVDKDEEMTARKAVVAVIRYLLGVLDQLERDWLTLTGDEITASASVPVEAVNTAAPPVAKTRKRVAEA